VPTYKTKGIIIKRVNYKEADKILTIFTPNMGKISALAKGVRKTTSKLGGHLELFGSVNLILAEGKGFDIVTSVEKNCHFKNLCFDLDKASHAYYVCELVDKFTHENFKDTRLYDLLFLTLDAVNCEIALNKKLDLILSSFKIKLLHILGFLPDLKKCVKCGKKDRENYFSSFLGGLICKDCFDVDRESLKISFECLKVLNFLELNNFENIKRLKIERKLSLEIEKVLDQFIRFNLERECKAKKLLNDVERLNVKLLNG
jgi:DNA repair protein RecO (recombination protein O)